MHSTYNAHFRLNHQCIAPTFPSLMLLIIQKTEAVVVPFLRQQFLHTGFN